MSDTSITKSSNRSSHRSRGRGSKKGSYRRNNQNRNRGREASGSRGRNRGGPRKRHATPPPKPVKLSFWERLLAAIGLGKKKHTSRPPKGREREEKKGGVRKSRGGVSTSEGERRPKQAIVYVETRRLHVGNLSYDTTESDLKDLFKGVGTVRSVEIIYNSQTHRSRGYGFVEMQQIAEAKRAVEVLNDQFFMGRKISVNPARGSKGADEEE